jgi:uncharacterized protein YgiM (DUF1202 family)
VRGGPGTDYKRVGSLASRETVDVIGKVEGKSWYMIQQDGVGSGFVSSSALNRTSTAMASTSPAASVPTDQVETKTVTAAQECRTVNQTIILADGSEKTEDVTACRGPNGWEVT